MGLFSKVMGTHSEREVRRVLPIVDKIESLEPEMEKLSDEELRGKTAEFKKRLADKETLDDILPEAYAVVREASKRTIGLRHFRVQLIGGVILHQGRITEMRTGEGKTLVSTLPAYLNALEGKGVHIVTVNDYLAKRDAEWMGQIHEFLGLTVGVILNSMDNDERREAYNCDITYATNNELGFDYLRDNMVIYKEQLVQRDLHYAIVDEVDSVLIDEARTPLIISGSSGKSTKIYEACDNLVRQLKKGTEKELSKMDIIMKEDNNETGDYVANEKEKTVNLTEQGIKKVERFFQIFWIDVRRSLNYAVTSVCKPDERESQILRLNIIVRQAIRIRHDLRHIVAHHPAQKIDIMNTLIHQRAAVLLPCAAPFCLFIVVAVPVPSDMRRAVQHPAETAVLNRFSDFLYRLIKSVLMAGTNR